MCGVVGVLWNALWRAVINVVQRAKLPVPNITKEPWDVLKDLKEDDSLMVLPADKGRASVVMNTNAYHAKDVQPQWERTLPVPKQRPNRPLGQQVFREAASLEHLTEAVYNKIRPRHKQPLRIWGLPKIHKAHVPLRTTVSCVNTF